ncbi:MAG: TIGR03087 family PEP-CTERM/XrtA system glycosyltransferase [Acidobacteriota bacterium]
MNVLFLTHRLPYAPNRGDRVRAYFLLQLLRRHAHVTLVSLIHDNDEAAHVGRLKDDGTDVHAVRTNRLHGLAHSVISLPTTRPITHAMLDAPGLIHTITAAVAARPPDVVLAYCSGMARLAFEPVLRDIPMVLDMVDVDSAKWADLAKVSRLPKSWIYRREARTLRHFERAATAKAVATLVVTERERETLEAIAPEGRILVVPNGIDVDALRPPEPPADSQDVVFCGVMNYAPNEQAATLLAREVWPAVKRRRPQATLTIVGSNPSAGVRALASASQGIVVTGAVPDVRPYLWRAAVAAAPLRTARGIQNKVLEAVAAGLPVVVTPNIFTSLPPTIADACIAAESAEALAGAIVSLLERQPAERRGLATRARVADLTWDRQLAAVPGLLDEAAARRPAAIGMAEQVVAS